jgi:hypothetical protein
METSALPDPLARAFRFQAMRPPPPRWTRLGICDADHKIVLFANFAVKRVESHRAIFDVPGELLQFRLWTDPSADHMAGRIIFVERPLTSTRNLLVDPKTVLTVPFAGSTTLPSLD